MITFYQLKTRFQRLLKPLLSGMRSAGITPNQITITAILLSFILGCCLWWITDFRSAYWIVPIGLFVRMALNALDGMMATTFKLQSKKGELLNELGDVISDLFIYVPLIQIAEIAPISVLIFVSLAIMNEFSGILAKVISGVRRYDGPMGKSDRAFVIGLTLLLIYFFPVVQDYFDEILITSSVLMIMSTLIRVRKSLL